MLLALSSTVLSHLSLSLLLPLLLPLSPPAAAPGRTAAPAARRQRRHVVARNGAEDASGHRSLSRRARPAATRQHAAEEHFAHKPQGG